MFRYDFECPACFKMPAQLEEIITGGVITFPILDVTEDEVLWNTDYMNVHESWTDRYQCAHCGYILKDPETQEVITEVDDLVKWLKENEK